MINKKGEYYNEIGKEKVKWYDSGIVHLIIILLAMGTFYLILYKAISGK